MSDEVPLDGVTCSVRVSIASSTPLTISSFGTTTVSPATSFSSIPSAFTLVSSLTPGPSGSEGDVA